MNILVTGATGMIGRRLCAFLLEQQPKPNLFALGRSASMQTGVHDIVIPEFTMAAIKAGFHDLKIDMVLHLMAAGVHPNDRAPKTLKDINAGLPPQMVSFAHDLGAKALVVAGSSAEYLPSSTSLSEDAPLEKEKLYGATKAAGGRAALEEARLRNIPLAVARIFNVYGPNEASHRLLPSLLEKLKRNEPVPLSAGTQVRDFIYVDDVCDALWQMAGGLISGKLSPGAYNVCTGNGTTVADFAKRVAQVCGCNEKLLQFGALPLRPDEAPYLVGNPARLKEKLGWQAKFSLSNGLTHVLAATSKAA